MSKITVEQKEQFLAELKNEWEGSIERDWGENEWFSSRHDPDSKALLVSHRGDYFTTILDVDDGDVETAIDIINALYKKTIPIKKQSYPNLKDLFCENITNS